ncbi:von Willebrand factor A domain-containing protein 7-like [Protopterus annectens]|uniref:von Willebrand factor A domain-containing protein 7-like n=1 Tax=Protopterus annectens TaxID=7888 RepID=UPI001CFB876A|nr:von Willebrand factor A domain-containing protein 7-like [Protopterus annectens]
MQTSLTELNKLFITTSASNTPYPVAPLAKVTCTDCTSLGGGVYDCKDNIAVKNLLTSGYKLSASCRTKPPGKCSHGGKNDFSQNYSPVGGINKESSEPSISPHHYLHQEAADMAIKATQDFFIDPGYGLLAQLGGNVFEQFFGLLGYSLTMAIDTTGSMSNDIQAVKEVAIELIRNFTNTPDAPYDYILVEFNDPDCGPVTKTRNVTEFEQKISSLRVDGGGDCPELSMCGLEKALLESLPRSKIYIFTDAGAKDAHLLDQNKILIEATKSEVHALLTGYCTLRSTQDVQQTKHEQQHMRKERATTSNIYEELAEFSGGYYVMTSKAGLKDVLGIMELSLNSAPVTITKMEEKRSTLSFPVDNTLVDVSVSVKSVSSGFTCTIEDSSGKTVKTNTVINTATQQVFKISPVEALGLWTLTISKEATYEIEVGGKSLLDFSYKIMEEQNGYTLPIQGRPVQGLNYTIALTLHGANDSMTIHNLTMLDQKGVNVLDSYNVQQSNSVNGKITATIPVQFNSPVLMLAIAGESSKSTFKRMHAEPIFTEAVRLVRQPGQNGTMIPGGSTSLSVLIINEGSDSEFTFAVAVDSIISVDFNPKQKILKKGENVSLEAKFLASSSIQSFKSSTATFSASSTSAKNYVKVPISVVPQDALVVDENSPEYQIDELLMPCLGTDIQHGKDCKNHLWNVAFTTWDTDSDVIVSLGTDPTPDNAHFSCTPENSSTILKQSCSYRATCCSPYQEFLISDFSGNGNILTIDYRAPEFPAARVTNLILIVCGSVLLVTIITSITICVIHHKRK